MNIQSSFASDVLTYQEDIRGILLETHCIPPRLGQDWSLKALYTPEDARRSPDLAGAVARELQDREVTRAFAPSVAAMSGAIVPSNHLSVSIPLTEEVTIFRNKDVPADGTTLNSRKKEAFLMSGGGCPIVIAIIGKHCVVAHASRESLIDRRRIETGKPSRKHEGVIQAIAAKAMALQEPFRNIPIRLVYAVEPAAFTHPFDDPVYGAANQRLYEDLTRRGLLGKKRNVMVPDTGELDIAALAEATARCMGFKDFKSFCTLRANGPYAHTRHSDPRLAQGRNLEIVRAIHKHA